MSDPQPEADWAAVRALFEQCLELDATDRSARLATAAPAIRSEVEALLAERADSRGRMNPEDCHRALLEATSAVVGVGSHIGGYRIVEVLGRGGMGTVYLAEQEKPRRRVALKLLTATVGGREAGRRFRLESELLGRLRHHGIAQIYEAAVYEEETSYGVVQWPYFAMEYVEGAKTLAAWAAERARTEQETLEVFLQVCDAVQHAHERGVVHRDLKPQNVLIDPDGKVKVIDFGIARGLGQDNEPLLALTGTGELLGTLRYMGPEQIRGDGMSIDTRTDVHALGVVLFELMTGRLPFEVTGKSLPEVGQIICETEARPLRQELPDADSDLELILATAMAKDPARRYASAGSMAEDLRRYLNREPIRARAPSLSYQLWMFARRRRGLVSAVVALLLVSTIGSVTSLIYAFRAQQAEKQAISEGEQKAGAMRLVFDNAMHSVLELPRRLEGAPGATQLRREVIEQAVEQLQFVEENAPLDRAMRYSLARAYRDLGGVQGGSFSGHEGDRPAALLSLTKARSYLDHVLDEDPNDVRAWFLLIDTELERGELVFEVKRDVDQTMSYWSAAEAGIERLRTLVPAGDPELLRAEAAFVTQCAQLAMNSQDFDSAVRSFERARDLRREALGGKEPDEATRFQLGGLYRFIGIAEHARGRLDESMAAFEHAVDALSFAERHPDDKALRRLYAMVRTRLGYAMASAGRYGSGEQHMRWAYAEQERMFAMDASDVALATSLATACQHLADHLSIQAKYAEGQAEARQLYTEARRLAARGLALARPLRERGRDMMNVYIVAECERIEAVCADALR